MYSDIQPTRPRRSPLRRLGRFTLGGIVAVLIVSVPSALASHDYTDVPDASPFHADIAAVKRAGITAGKTCEPPGTPPTYCPSEPITREAMAAFVHRGAGRVGLGAAGGVTVTNGGVSLGDLTISVGGVPGQTQFVMLTAQVDTQIQSLSGCPCRTDFGVYSDQLGDYSFIGATMNDSLPAGGGSVSDGIQSAVAAGIVAVPSGTTQTFHIYAFLVGGTGTVTGYGTLNAITAPFGSTGTNTLGEQASGLANRHGRTLPPPPKR